MGGAGTRESLARLEALEAPPPLLRAAAAGAGLRSAGALRAVTPAREA